MPDMFSPAQMATLRDALAVPDGAPDPTAADVLAVAGAQRIVNEASERWLNPDLGPWDD